jgi:hypothetical protein
MAKVSNTPVQYIRATISKMTLDSVQYKPYSAELTFGEKLIVEIPTDASEVKKEGDELVLTLDGLTTPMKNYTIAIENMNREKNLTYRQ